jgi:hypothetical protein
MDLFRVTTNKLSGHPLILISRVPLSHTIFLNTAGLASFFNSVNVARAMQRPRAVVSHNLSECAGLGI